MTSSLIRITGLTKHYQMGGTTVRAFNGVDLDIEVRIFTFVMGLQARAKVVCFICSEGWTAPRLAKFRSTVNASIKWMKMRSRFFATGQRDSLFNPII